jgi:GR25 family glycosyltransferase involved in LPS biosynthesis
MRSAYDMKLKGFYINLDSAVRRRSMLDEHMQKVGLSPRIELERFSAIVPNEAQRREFHSSLPDFSSGHMGCYLSHRACLEKRIAIGGDDSHHMVVEDDVIFSHQTERRLFETLDYLADKEWDLLYTDFIVETDAQKNELYMARHAFDGNSVSLLDLHTRHFTGATCYIVNVRSLKKFHDVLAALSPVSKLLDWHVKQAVHAGQLKAFSVFPFITSVSPEADASTIDGGIPLSHINNRYRRHIWLDSPAFAVGGGAVAKIMKYTNMMAGRSFTSGQIIPTHLSL